MKKEKNIWNFNPNLAEYFPNGKIMRSLTILNHFKDECHKLLSTFGEIESYEWKNEEIIEVLEKKCKRIEYTPSDLVVYLYQFDNGLEIYLNNYEIERIVQILTDEVV